MYNIILARYNIIFVGCLSLLTYTVRIDSGNIYTYVT